MAMKKFTKVFLVLLINVAIAKLLYDHGSIRRIGLRRASPFLLDKIRVLPKHELISCALNLSKWKRTSPPYYIDIRDYDLSNFTFITGSSRNHFVESEDLIASIQTHFPKKKIYYYDLGLTKGQINKLKSWCNVVYTKWDVSVYPKHVSDIAHYAFKALVIHEALMRFDAVFWLDASGRISQEATQSDWQLVYKTAQVTDGIVMFLPTGRDIFQCTNRAMYRYIPTDEEKLKRFQMYGSGAVLLYRTKNVFNEIISCWRLCSLAAECNQPRGHQKHCPPAKPGVSICHRYDQSSLNILAAKYLKYKEIVRPRKQNVITVRRFPTKLYRLMTSCNETNR